MSQGGIQASASSSNVKLKVFWFSSFYILFALGSFKFILVELRRKTSITSCRSGTKYLGKGGKVKDKCFINVYN